MSELFDTSAFSSLDNDAARDFEIEDISSKKKVQKSPYKPDSAWDDGSAFPRNEPPGILPVVTFAEISSKKSDCWYTPPEIVDLIQQCLDGITLDPCADDGKHIESCQHLTVVDDGLSHQWSGRVFMNPPYSCPGVWIAKLQEEFNCRRVEEAIALVPVATDTKWFHPLISSNLICFWKGRIKFLDTNYQPKMAARQSHCLIYWGKNQSRFRQIFSSFGSFNFLEERGDSLYSLGSKVKVTNSQKYYSDSDWGIITGLTIKDGKIDVKMGDRFIIAVDIADLFLEEEVRNFKVSDRFEIISPKKYSGEKGCLSGYHTNDSPEFWVKLDNHDLQIRVFPNQVKFLEEKGATECNSHSLISAQELVPVSPLPLQNLDLASLEPQRLTPTVAVSSQNDSQNCITMAIYENSPTLELLDSDQEQLILSPPVPPALLSPQKDSVKEPMTNEIVSPQSSKLLQITNPDLPLLKMLQGCSLAPIAQEMSGVTSGMFFRSFPPAGTMRNGLLSEAATVMLPSLESEYCWLPSPGALSLSGKGRPPGQTKQEALLKEKGAIKGGQVVNPEFLESAYNLPLGWTNPRENRSALELLAEMESCVLAASPLEMPLTGELPVLDFAASPTSTHYAENQQLQQFKAITLHQPWAYFVGRYKWFETRNWSTNYRGKIAIHAAKHQKDTDHWCSLLKDLLSEKLVFSAVVAIADLTDCILMTEEFISQQSETELGCGLWEPGRYAWKLENVQILPEPIPARGKQGLWDIELPVITPQHLIEKFLEDKSNFGLCEATHENFLEETKPATTFTEKSKRRQRKGCLYRYVENKKLKNGDVASYPRVIGHREQGNTTHWRWGFNWEEKVDGEWKGRSIGSVPLGAIALIQSMQNEGVSLEEIIGFIRRAKSKKC